ncbi:MAG: hypothetical protein IJN59_00840, partial [Oscillospiraceae bacterium]|nr:hypothetical protein [Oscillospiraceae bacterium]
DAYVVFDADNIPAPDFLQRINDAFAAGERVCKGRLKAGNYTESWVSGGYGLKVKEEPGYGDALTMIYDDEEVEVLAIVTWEEADDDELLYWGNIEWEGHDAYVCMAYLEKAE